MTLFSITDQIKEADLEPIYAHLNHGRVFPFLEKARVQLLTHIGLPLDDMLATGLSLVITNINIFYKREIMTGPIEITCENGKVKGRDLIIDQQIFNARGKSAVQATVTSTFMSLETRRAVSAPPGYADKFDAWFKANK